ncbi:hypothetical protein N9562_00270 [Flavobacteriaceae bacterium]|nr:hypothetical protein [Flavobacteriaceae bacterium]
MNESKRFKKAESLKENLETVLYQLQHLMVDGVSLETKLRIDGFVTLSKQEIKEDRDNLVVAYNLSQALVSMVEGIKSPKTEGVSGAIYQAEQHIKRKAKSKISNEDKLMMRLEESLKKLKNNKKKK